MPRSASAVHATRRGRACQCAGARGACRPGGRAGRGCRVALAAATEERHEHLFNAVSEEVGRLLGARSAATVRYVEDADESVIVGGWGREERYVVDVGARLPFQEARSSASSAPGERARVDRERVAGGAADDGLDRGLVSGSRADRRLRPPLGATSVSLGPTDSFPPEAEERLGQVHARRRGRPRERAGAGGAGRSGRRAGCRQPRRRRRRDRVDRAPVRHRVGRGGAVRRARPRRAATSRTAQTS